MINELTKEQEEMLDIYAEKYIKLGLNTDRFNKEYALPIIHNFQEKVLETAKTDILIFDNPLECNIALYYFYLIKEQSITDYIDKVRYKVRDKVRDKVRAKVRAKVWDEVRDKVRDKVMYKVDDKVRYEVRDKVEDRVRDKVEDKVKDKAWDKVRDEVDDKVRYKVDDKVRKEIINKIEGIYPYQEGSFFASVFSFYDYCQEVLGIDLSKFMYKEWRDTINLGLIYPLDDICIVCQKPKYIYTNKQGDLHADGKMALEYEGGWGIYSLNGIIVPEYLAITPAEKLDLDFFHKEENADIRSEFIRKYGIDRMVSLGKSIDKFNNYSNDWWNMSEYELIDMSSIFKTIEYAPYLKMKNLTTGIYHLEPVHPDCKNIKDAFEKTRWNGRKIEDYLTINIK